MKKASTSIYGHWRIVWMHAWDQEYIDLVEPGYVRINNQGNGSPGDELVAYYITELEKDEPNHPLFRRYFRQGNTQLLALLRYGLEHNPTNSDLLNDLGFYHVFSPVLKELITYYSKACEVVQDMTLYRKLAQDFHINCSASGYEAFYAPDEKLSEHDLKKAVLKELEHHAF